MKKLLIQIKRLDRPEVILVLGLVLIFVLPGIIAKTSLWFSFDASTGVIGDTIGGITAPISGFLGAYLVWKALKEQIKANIIITEQFTEQKITTIVIEQLKILREEIKDYTIESTYWAETGMKAIETVLNGFPDRHIEREIGSNANLFLYIDKIGEIEYFLNSIWYLINLVNGASLKAIDKTNLYSLILETYNSKIRNALVENEKKRISKQKQCEHCTEIHGIPENIYILFDEIEKIKNINR